MTRKILIVGLILLAALLPMAVGPIAIVVGGALVFIAGVASMVRVSAPPVTFVALRPSRAPPSR